MSSHPGLSYTQAGSLGRARLERLCRYALFLCLALAGVAFLPHRAHAQTVPPAPFQIIGHIEKFTEDSPGAILGSGKMTVNGIDVVIPKNTVLVFPASYQTMSQVFDGPHPKTPLTGLARKSGLAMADLPPPIAAFEATIVGNLVNGTYIAGLVFISQQSVNTADGFIKSINFVTGELCVGSTPAPVAGCLPPNSRVRINDPIGRYGLADGPTKVSPDERFSVDTDNPTIHAKNGYPMCVPRVAPPAADPLCPITNRPLGPTGPLTQFTSPNPTQQVPLMLGDYITFQGTHAKDANPLNPLYVSAHTIEGNVAAFTPPGVTPYVFMEASKIGAGPSLVCPGAECANLTVDVGFTTDPTQTPNAAIYALDVGLDGIRRTRKLLVPSIKQAVVGRFRLDIAKAPQLLDSINPQTRLAGGATREYMLRIDDPQRSPALADGSLVPDAGNSPGLVRANGLIPGQYVFPMFDYIFGEGQPGGQPPPANFQCLAFLATGWGIKGQVLNIGQLSPWPDTIAPTAVSCATAN